MLARLCTTHPAVAVSRRRKRFQNHVCTSGGHFLEGAKRGLQCGVGLVAQLAAQVIVQGNVIGRCVATVWF